MKYINIFAVVLFISITAAYGQTQTPALVQSSFKFAEAVHDFGKIKQGTPVTTTFTFTNVGDKPIVISDVKVTCGCTVPDFSKDPVLPGATGTIKATYNAAKLGAFDKDLSIVTNVSAVDVKVKIKGEVEAQ